MEATYSDNGRSVRGDAKALKNDANDAVQKHREAIGQELRNLMADVQDLLGRVAHVADPEIARLRTKVEGGLVTAKQALAAGKDQVQRQAKDAVNAGDRIVRDQPWQAVGVAALAGLLVGFLVGRR